MLAASAGAAFAAAAPPAAEAAGGGGGGGGPYIGLGPSLGPRQIRIRCLDSRRSISLRSCSFISSTSWRMRPTSKIPSELPLDSLIAVFRSGDVGLGGGFLPSGRVGRRLSESAMRKKSEIRGYSRGAVWERW